MKAEDPKSRDDRDASYGRKYGPAVTLGYTLIGGMIFFTALGYYMDHSFKTQGLWTLCGMFMGLVYGGYEVWKLVRKIQRQDKAASGEGPKP